MKTTDKRNIMILAWRVFRTTGRTFSECLKTAWANFRLAIAMRTRIVEFHYEKLNGETRQAFGRLYDLPEPKGSTRKPNENLFTYFDTVAGEYRSFYRHNLVSIG
jgi:hypothetical protein